MTDEIINWAGLDIYYMFGNIWKSLVAVEKGTETCVTGNAKTNTSENSFKMPNILSRNGRVPEVTNCLQVIWSN